MSDDETGELEPESGWLLLAAGDDRQHGGNEGYDDLPDRHYSWDDTVGNHARLQEGHPIALWDKNHLLGASVIDRIDTRETTKSVFRCAKCGGARIKARKMATPRFKCFECGKTFDEAAAKVVDIVEYRSHHEAGWVDLNGLLDGPTLRALCVQPKAQLSLRPLRWYDFRSTLAAVSPVRLTTLRRASAVAHGHATATVRVRRGQATFRQRLLKTHGEVCAFSGPAPREALDAAHLYSYAAHGVHHEDGGLLLRRDLHVLFDQGFLAVDPASLTVDVADRLTPFGLYASLHGRRLAMMPTSRQRKWLTLHWDQHRG